MSHTIQDDERAQLQAALAALTLQVTDLQNQINKINQLQTANGRSQNAQAPITTLPGHRTLSSPTNLGSIETPMAATRMVTAQMVSPADGNGLGICMGGVVLSWIDVCAGLAAKTLARGPCVTASVDAVHFLKPCRVGSVIIVAAMVNRTFKSSMEVGVRVEEECPLSGVRHHCCSAYLTFVAISPLPPLTFSNNGGNSGGSPSTFTTSAATNSITGRRELPRVIPGTSKRLQLTYSEAGKRREWRLEKRQHLRDDPEASAAAAACRLIPVTHRVGTRTMPPSLRTSIENNNKSTTGTTGTSQTQAVPLRHSIPASLTTAHSTHIVMPNAANSIGVTFGGQILRWVEEAAFVVATRISRGGHVLTATMDEVTFLRPTRVGDTVYLEAQATAVFGSSVEVMISVWGEVPEEGKPFHCGDAYATIVSVNSQGQPMNIPFEIVPQTREEDLRYKGAVARREARLELREAMLDKAKRLSLDESGDDADAWKLNQERSQEVREEIMKREAEDALVKAMAVA
jgi:acyl-CoA hydrolase